MQDIPKAQILRRIELENPWWTRQAGVSPTYTRVAPRPYLNLFYPLVANRSVRRAPILMGPRRVGKTYLLHHCIQALLKDGVPPKQICYLSVDSPIYVNLPLERFLDLYSDATGISYLSEPTYFFFDEIQYLKNWEQHLKSIVDTFPLVQCTASGSAAAALRMKSHESGAGRFTDFLLPPLTFYEYLNLMGVEEELVYVERRGAQDYYGLYDVHLLNEHFARYINYGGYPEVALSGDIQANPERFVKSDIIDKVLLRDLPSLYGISDIQELNSLFTSLAFNTSQEIALEELAKNSGVAKPTIKRYMEYLEAAFLIKVVHRVDESVRYFKRARNFKVYLTNPSLRAALFGAMSADDDSFGHLVETGVFAQWFHSESQNLYYARWKRGELDIVSLRPDQRVEWAVEVKWSDRLARQPEAAMKEVLAFCRNNNVRELTVTTRTLTLNKAIENVEIYFWPAALYAYAAGHSILNSKVLALSGKATAP